MTRRIRLVVEYDGTDYCGWQRQDNGPSIQATLEEAVGRMTGEKLVVHGAGRTDAGVHALGQVAAFSTENMRIPVIGFRRGLGTMLPNAIAVVHVDEVPLSFDPRRDARGKIYRYRIWNSEPRSPLRDRSMWHSPRPLDASAMQAAAQFLVGEHDYVAFRAADCDRKNTVRRIRRIEVTRQGPLVTVEVEATAFLKNMVRIIVGTLTDVGHGAAHASDPRWIEQLLVGRDRRRAGPTAPPEGLSLVRVHYDPPLPSLPDFREVLLD